jgi:hypothetical protein
MSVFLMDSRTAWNDHFTGSYTTILNSQTYNSQQTPSGTGVYVSNCLFRSIISSSRGGALCCTSVTYFLVESTSFFSCKTNSGNGGAIYFNCDSGQSVLNKVCGYDCFAAFAGSYFQFAYIVVGNAISYKNYVNYSSISCCVSENSNTYYTFCLDFGKQCCLSINSSMNKCYYRSGINCLATGDPNSVTCSLSYSSFTDNIAIGYTCIRLSNGGANYEIKSCNILRNTQGTLGSEGTICINGNLMINDSCILDNDATNIFYQSSSSYITTLTNCTVDSTSNNGYLTTRNTVTKSFILALNHMSTQNCHSEYDSAGTLTPIIQSPSLSKNQKLYCSCNYSRIRDFVSLLSVFLFNFIHLDVS